ncbi:hypothetical protein LTR09_005880 [Extremus antarcticus]|uniref:Microtubule associated protein n=1 Tax=Extremus antarcticus TaxID=702011 RepID=A0AAJ0GC83_9PEZI|nr:hypothetical protein LTR09_005880 [Extremus antarcticus]
MVQPTRPPANGFVAAMRHVYNPIGFGKGYNFVLFGYIFAFSLSRTSFFSFYGIFCNRDVIAAGNGSAPGECFYWLRNPYKIGMFVPIVRHKLIILHRINGYLVILLSSIASAGAIIIAPHSNGGDMATRMVAGVLVISTTVAFILAWINIKRLQIDQHRAWMLRAWAYFSTIITLRLIMLCYSEIISIDPEFTVTRPCKQIDFLFQSQDFVLSLYPDCAPFYNGTSPEQMVIVLADINSADPMQISASFGVGFGAAGCLALWIHAIAVEVYLRLTPAEGERLKEVSYQRQRERGFRNPGTAGLTAEKQGDANPYVPVSHRKVVDHPEELDMLSKDRRYSPVSGDDEER